MLLCPSLFWGLFVPFGLDFGGYFLEIVRNHLFSKQALLCQLDEARGLCDLRENRSPLFSWGRNNRRESLFSFLPVRDALIQAERMCFRLYTRLVVESTAIPSEKPKSSGWYSQQS